MRNISGFNPFAQQQFHVQQPQVARPQGNPFGQAGGNTGSTGGAGGDALGLFKQQIQAGQLNINPNQPRPAEGVGGRFNVSV